MGIVEKRRVPYELLICALAANLEQAKHAGLNLGKKSHRIEMIIQVARNDVINDIGIKKKERKNRNELLAGSRAVATPSMMI